MPVPAHKTRKAIKSRTVAAQTVVAIDKGVPEKMNLPKNDVMIKRNRDRGEE